MSPVIHHHHPVPVEVSLAPERLFVYEFEISQLLVGLLIGKMGAYVHYIKAQTGAQLLIKDHNKRYKMCAVEGKEKMINIPSP